MPCLDRSGPKPLFLLIHCFEKKTSNKQTQGFGRVVFAIPALVAGEVESESHQIKGLFRSRGKTRIKGPLITEATNQQRLFREKQAQKSSEVEKGRVALNLQLNQEGLLECRGRLQRDYPMYLPDTSLFAHL